MRKALSALVGGFAVVTSSPATAAQLGAVVSVFSDDRLRGVSVSDGHPVTILDLSFDDPSGFYASLSGTIVAEQDDGIKALSVNLGAGYAKRLRAGLAADVGVFRSRYSHYSGLSAGRDFTEAYAGLSGRFVSARLAVSPDYLGIAKWTTHGELDAHFELSQRLILEGEVGLLVPFGRTLHEKDLAPQADAQFGLARRAGPATFHALVSVRSGSDAAYGGGGRGRIALVVGLSTSL
jgi:uncharacterized protein (TIGR02001 family)